MLKMMKKSSQKRYFFIKMTNKCFYANPTPKGNSAF